MSDFETFGEKRKSNVNRAVWIACGLLLCAIIGLEIGILANRKSGSESSGTNNKKEKGEATAAPTPTEEPYILINENENTVISRFNTPKGYKRVDVEGGSFGEYLRNLELKSWGEGAFLFSGAESDEASKLGVIVQDTPVIKAQQCADTAMLFYGEYCFKNGKYDKISFEFCDGFVCDFETWASGMRPNVVDKKKTTWIDKKGTAGVIDGDYSFENFIEYIKFVYVYSNTDSLVTELPTKNADDLKPGDLFIVSQYQLAQQAKAQGITTPTYGHAMMVADVCVNDEGEKMFMLIEGTTPATDPVVVENPAAPGTVWFKFSEDGTFVKSTSGIKWQSTWIYTFEK